MGRLATRYTTLIVALLGVALVASASLETWASHRERLAALEELQHEKAGAVAEAVSRYLDDTVRSLKWVTLPSSGAPADLHQRHSGFLRLLRLEPAFHSATLIDAHGREQVHVSRWDWENRIGSGADRSATPGLDVARTGRVHLGGLEFYDSRLPYITVAVPAQEDVVWAVVSLGFIRNVTADIKVGHTGYAYVVDAHGRLIGDPHSSVFVSPPVDLAALPQVRAALAPGAAPRGFVAEGRDRADRPVLAAYAPIDSTGWRVFVEQPRAEALAPLFASMRRNALILCAALLLALAAGVVAARRMAAPIEQLRRGAVRYGAGDLSHRIEVASGDELQDLASQFNAMGLQLRETYASLEARVAERTRELDLANQAKSRFLAAASHDLRQPVHALSLFVGQVHASTTEAERAALMQRMEAAVGNLGELLDRLLDLSRLDAGAVPVLLQDFGIQEQLLAAQAELAPLAQVKGLALRILPCEARVHGDPVLVRRIVLNLLANAIRYTERGAVLVVCRQRGGRLRIAVWDTGCGIPRERRSDIFHEFVQLRAPDGRETRAGGGLGLGLAIVARLARLLGTRVELRSRVGRGSMFAFELPLGGPSAPVAAATPAAGSALSGTFVLVVDDDEAARAGMCGLLHGWGCLTLPAAGSADAIRQLQDHDRPPELIVSDLRLGADDDGLHLIARVREVVQEPVPAVLVSADTSTAAAIDAQAAGVPLLHKPVSPAKLRALLVSLMSAPAREPAAV